MEFYQLNPKFWVKTSDKNIFNQLTTEFEETITKFKLDSIKKELDLDLLYTPNHACLWNKIENIGKPCRILEKNDKLILVGFIGSNTTEVLNNIPKHLYRIEDISIYKK